MRLSIEDMPIKEARLNNTLNIYNSEHTYDNEDHQNTLINIKNKKLNENIFVIIPAYNEEKVIDKIIENINKNLYKAKIIVVNDGSNDLTYEKAINSGAFVVSHKSNKGQWAALRTGFNVSLSYNPKVIVTLDGDGQHNSKDINRIIKPILRNECDLVIATRFRNNKNINMIKYRYFGIKLFNYLMKIRTGMQLTDCTNGFKAYDPILIKKILPSLKEDQYGALESLIQISKYKIKYKEIPITSINSSKSRKGGLKYGINLLRIIIKSLFTK